jgi:hypothetical protein
LTQAQLRFTFAFLKTQPPSPNRRRDVTPVDAPPGWRPPAQSEHAALRGRGSAENPAGRFERLHHVEDLEASERARLDAEEGTTRARLPRTQYLRDATRSVLVRNNSPDVGFDVGLITKNALITRDVDLLGELARWNATTVHISVTTLDSSLHRVMEPRASHPAQRLRAIETLARAGVPVAVLVGPVIPGLTDHEIPAILEAAASAGAHSATRILLRLPGAVEQLFRAGLDGELPEPTADHFRRPRRGQFELFDPAPAAPHQSAIR